MRWRLQYARAVTSYLYSLREAGHELHTIIKALQEEPEPWQKARPIAERPGRYEFEALGHWVGFDVVQKEEPTIRIIYIQAM